MVSATDNCVGTSRGEVCCVIVLVELAMGTFFAIVTS